MKYQEYLELVTIKLPQGEAMKTSRFELDTHTKTSKLTFFYNTLRLAFFHTRGFCPHTRKYGSNS